MWISIYPSNTDFGYCIIKVKAKKDIVPFATEYLEELEKIANITLHRADTEYCESLKRDVAQTYYLNSSLQIDYLRKKGVQIFYTQRWRDRNNPYTQRW